MKNGIIKDISKQYRLKDDKKIILAIGRRRENFGQGFINIYETFKTLALNNPHIDIVFLKERK